MILPQANHSQLMTEPPPPNARSLSRGRRAMPSPARSLLLATVRPYRLHTFSLVRDFAPAAAITFLFRFDRPARSVPCGPFIVTLSDTPNSRGGFMEPAASLVPITVSNRAVACLWCHAATARADVIRNHGLCQSCAQENGEISWRLVYDRDRQIGSIPSNLRAAYGL